MSFRQNAWAKVWEITTGERSTKVRISTSKKNKQTGEYEQDFSGYVTLSGAAHRDATKLKVGDSIRIGECEVTSRYNKEKKVSYTNFAIFTFETNDQNNSDSAAENTAKEESVSYVEKDPDEDLPF